MAVYFSTKIVADMFDSKVGWRDKLWLYRHGFFSTRFKHYNMTKANYKDYLSDYDYYKMHPLNNQMARGWIDDKLTTKYVFAPYDEFYPAYYFMLNKGRVVGLHNVERNKEYTIDDVVEQLKKSDTLAFKMDASALGVGFYKVEYKDGTVLLNEEETSMDDFKKFLHELDNYLVMEYIYAHPEIRKYYKGSSSVLRVMVINEDKPVIANTYIRVGTNESGVLDANSGMVVSVVDIDTGEYGKETYYESGFDFIKITEHPDSQIPFKGIIPRWEFIKEKVLEMAAYVPQLTYMGFDVCITEDGFKIYEINSHQGIELYQLSYPLLKDNPAAEFFKSHTK